MHISQKHADQIGLNTHGQVWDIFLERQMKNLVTSLLNRHLLLIFFAPQGRAEKQAPESTA